MALPSPRRSITSWISFRSTRFNRPCKYGSRAVQFHGGSFKSISYHLTVRTEPDVPVRLQAIRPLMTMPVYGVLWIKLFEIRLRPLCHAKIAGDAQFNSPM